MPVTLDEAVKKMKVERSDAARIAGDRPILCYKSTVVPFEYEGRGHFQALAHVAMSTAREQGYGSMFSTAWTYDGYTPLARPFAQHHPGSEPESAADRGGDFYDFFMVDDRHLAVVMADIDVFVGDAPQFDDITMLCLEFQHYMEEESRSAY